jgi:hypothetical protein
MNFSICLITPFLIQTAHKAGIYECGEGVAD